MSEHDDVSASRSRLEIHHIEDLDDPRVTEYRSLRRIASLKRDRRFVAEGARVVRQLLSSTLSVQSLLLDAKWLEAFGSQLAERPEERIQAFVTTKPELERIVGFHVHQGVMAIAEAPEPPSFAEHLRQTECPLLVSISGVAQAENVGSILRNMAGFGGTGLLFDAASCDPFVRRATRVSMGAVFRIPVWRSEDLPADIRMLREECGVRAVAAHVRDERMSLDDADLAGPLLLALGSEADGVPDAVVAACDATVEIPMADGWSCINVGMASAVILHEIARRRRASS